MLTEHKSEINHYYTDDRGRFQGEYKSWFFTGRREVQCFYKNDMHHGEYKCWPYFDDSPIHHFYKEGKNITKEVIALVEDISNITHKEKMIIKLKFGIDCISKEIKCIN